MSISTFRKREQNSSPGALTLSRKNPKCVGLEMTESGGPSRRRIDDVQQLEGDACREDFALLFNAETSNKLLERWEVAFKQKIINEAQFLTSTAEVRCLLNAAGGQGSENDWDGDMSHDLLLLHLLPSAPGRKKTKISPTEAADKLVHYHKSCTSIEGHLSRRKGHQPFLLRSGRIKGRINHFYVVVDKRLIPCVGTSSLSAFELFKVHCLQPVLRGSPGVKSQQLVLQAF